MSHTSRFKAALPVALLLAVAGWPRMGQASPATTKGALELLRSAVATQFQVPIADTEVRPLLPDLRTLAGTVPDGVRLRLPAPPRQLGPAVAVKLELVSSDGRVVRSVLPRYAIEAWRDLPVVSRGLSRGAVLGSAELEVRRMPLSRVPRDVMQELGALIGAKLLRPLASGSVVVPASVDLPPVIRQGTTVRVVVRSGGLQVLGQGTALQDGRVGQFIRVLNPTSRKDFMARVRDPEVVEINMGEVEE
ncbi:MAG: flagellar basal body P-ring formation chaperone FlgA [Candidatus Sericytochromatia bacterium]|nr:flagellar basal body P-ring formation chaperone FlgA [Candidatus Sericytochromatia bacterium]